MYIIKNNEPFTTITDKTPHRKVFKKTNHPYDCMNELNTYYPDEILNIIYINCEKPVNEFLILYDQYQQHYYYNNNDFREYRPNDDPDKSPIYYLDLKGIEVRDVFYNDGKINELIPLAYARDNLFFDDGKYYYIDGDCLFINFNPELCRVSIFNRRK